MSDEKYTYSLSPRKRMRTKFESLNSVRIPRTMLLSKEEVVEALKFASVYRRFNSKLCVKVTVMNLDRLHNAEYDPVGEQEIKPINLGNNNEEKVEEKVEEPIIEEPKKEEIIDSKVDETELPYNDEEKVDNTVTEEIGESEDTLSQVSTKVESENIDNVDDFIPEPEVEIVEEVKEENIQKKYNNSGKKHH